MVLGDATPAAHPAARDTRKRRSRGSLYAVHLWGANPLHSGDLEYVRSHGEQLIHKVINEDENWKYVSLKQVQDVRIYTPVAPPDGDTGTSSSATSTTEAALTASSGRTLSATSATSAKDQLSAPRMLPGRCDFRAMTRAAGSLETIMEILAADEDREAYWTALNTQKGLRANQLFGSRRLAADAPFPRWSQRYMATRFTKYSTKSVDCCFAEYAKLAPAAKGELRHGFIYRRSVDESLFKMEAIKARMAKYDDECERMYIQDWLYEVAETSERNVCKVVLTCSVYFSGDYSRSLRAEFHDFATDVMVQIRKVLAKHWRELQGEPAEDATHQSTAAALLTNAFHLVKPGQARYCSVCSDKFSLLRKRHACRTCCASVCSKCSTVTKRMGSGQPVPGERSSGSGPDRECTLCIQFSDETTDSHSSASAHHNFVTGISSSATEYDDEEEDGVSIGGGGGGSVTSSSRSIVGSYDVRKHYFTNPSSSSSAHKTPPSTSISVTMDSLHGVPRKARNDSSDSTRSSKSTPDAGVVLLSDLDALTLSGRGRGVAVAAQSRADTKRLNRTFSEDNVLHSRDSLLDEDDLASFTLKLSMQHQMTAPRPSSGMCSASLASESSRRTLKDPRISVTSLQEVRCELEALEQGEIVQQHRWSLCFVNSVMEKRFQVYHEEISLRSSRIGCSCTLAGLVVMQSVAFYDLFVVAGRREDRNMDATRWSLVLVGVGLTVLLGVAWVGFLYRCQETRQALQGRFQGVLSALGVCTVLVVLAQPAYSSASLLESNSIVMDEARRSHLLTKTILFLVMGLGAIATVWNAQFLTYAAIAGLSFLALSGWLVSYVVYLQHNWHVVLLFISSVVMLGHSLRRSERNLRLKFLQLRHLMLENMKLSQQNTFMQQQLSSHVDAIGIHDHLDFDQNPARPLDYFTNGVSGAGGESWMENVLKVLCQLKLNHSNNDEMTRDLDFVMQTLTSEQDLFLENRARRTRGVGTQSRADAETGWLALIEEQRHRRRKSCDLGVVVSVPVVKTVRRTDSGLRQTVLTQVKNYLMAGQRHTGALQSSAAASNSHASTTLPVAAASKVKRATNALLSSEKWTSKKLLARAARSEEFDLLGFAKACVFPLTSIFLTTLESHNLFVELPLRVQIAAEYGLEIESRYQAKNPHAASVVWDINFLLRRLQQPVTPLQVFSALLAGAVHDVNHPGMNNAYLVTTSSPLAIKYSDDSVLERMHLAEAFQAATKEGCDIFEDFPKEVKRQSRQMIIKMVLATDLSGHLKHVNRLKSKRYVVHSTSSLDLLASSPPSSSSTSIPGSCVGGPNGLPDDLVFHSVIMMADLGHAIKSFESHFAWSKLVTEEFFKQGDTERQFGMPISPLCDRHNSRFERSQIGFLEFVVLPLYSAAREVLALADFDTVLDRIQNNLATWKQRAEQLEQEQEQNPGGASPSGGHESLPGTSQPAATGTALASTKVPEQSKSKREEDDSGVPRVGPAISERDGHLHEVINVVVAAPLP
ncbi:hypothetical protein PybrP1_012783 [[Pythium] brassicae (nom. inval.)]|nr:hypothetical protein PybrP1_012783 [[Pythium] brassicae (nom. inval.)]